MRLLSRCFAALLFAVAMPAVAQSPYAERITEADHIVRDFAFASGEKLPEVRIHYTTLGTPKRDAEGRVTNAVMVLHGTGGTGHQFLLPRFADELYGPGQPLDISKYYIILPDNVGHGKSSKPSDGLGMGFPDYDYADMVELQRRLLVDGLKVDRLRLMMGTSMGCMHGFIWAEEHPDFAQAMMPMACLPVEIAGLNRMWRKAAIEGIMQDPAWREGNYEAQPVLGLRTAVSLLTVAGGAPLQLQQDFPTREAADAYVVDRIDADIKTRDANDLIHALESSRTYDPSAKLETIRVPMMWINSEDDFINPSNYGIAEAAAKRLPTARFILLPESVETRGHGSHTWARLWKGELIDLLARTEGNSGR